MVPAVGNLLINRHPLAAHGTNRAQGKAIIRGVNSRKLTLGVLKRICLNSSKRALGVLKRICHHNKRQTGVLKIMCSSKRGGVLRLAHLKSNKRALGVQHSKLRLMPPICGTIQEQGSK